jgi:hypothetical protein
MLGRPDAGPVYEGGHFISDEILGKDSYNEYNFAPQDDKLNAPLWRHFEELAKDGPTHVTTGNDAPTWTYKVKVRYPPDYARTARQLESAGVLPPNIANLNPSKVVTFPRRVPDLWEAELHAPPNHTFNEEELSSTSHAYTYYASKASDIVTQAATARQGSGLVDLGMDSLKMEVTAGGTEKFIGGHQTETFAALQYFPQDIAQQPARTVTGPGGVVTTPLLPQPRVSKLAQPCNLKKAIEKPTSKHRQTIQAAYPLAGYVWRQALPWAWKLLNHPPLPTPLEVLKKAMEWKGKTSAGVKGRSVGKKKPQVAEPQKRLLRALSRDPNLVI